MLYHVYNHTSSFKVVVTSHKLKVKDQPLFCLHQTNLNVLNNLCTIDRLCCTQLYQPTTLRTTAMRFLLVSMVYSQSVGSESLSKMAAPNKVDKFLQDLKEYYCKTVRNNPQTVGQLESSLRILSFLVAGMNLENFICQRKVIFNFLKTKVGCLSLIKDTSPQRLLAPHKTHHQHIRQLSPQVGYKSPTSPSRLPSSHKPV